MKSEEINSRIDRFIEDNTYKYAIMINGDWGSGKTYYVNEILIPHMENRKYKMNKKEEEKSIDINYISLYGIRETSDISELLCSQIVKDMIPKLKNNQSRLSKAVSYVTDAISKYAIKKTEIGNEADLERFLSLLPNFDNNVIIFDDLERCSCDVNDILGYINNFVEHSNVKVIIVANENEIGKDSLESVREKHMLVETEEQMKKKEESEASSKEETEDELSEETIEWNVEFNGNDKYRRIKEKVIGETITYEPDLKNVFMEIITKNTEGLLRDILLELVDELVKFANTDNHKNLRTFLFFLDKIKTILDIVDNKYADEYRNIILYCYRSSIYLMSWEKQLPTWDNKEYGYQHFGGIRGDDLFGYAFIDTFIRTGHIDKENVDFIMGQNEKRKNAEDDPSQLIKNWRQHEDQEIKTWMMEIREKIVTDYYSIEYYPELIHNLLQMKFNGVFSESIDNTIEQLQEHCKKMTLMNDVHFTAEKFVSGSDEEECEYNKIMDNLSRILIEKQTYVDKTEYEIIFSNKRGDWTKAIMEKMLKDGKINGWSFIYWISPEKIARKLLICNNKELDVFRCVIAKIYDGTLQYNKVKDDHANFMALYQYIRNISGISSLGEIQRNNFRQLHEDMGNIIRQYL